MPMTTKITCCINFNAMFIISDEGNFAMSLKNISKEVFLMSQRDKTALDMPGYPNFGAVLAL